jgi:hypothetical protein
METHLISGEARPLTCEALDAVTGGEYAVSVVVGNVAIQFGFEDGGTVWSHTTNMDTGWCYNITSG